MCLTYHHTIIFCVLFFYTEALTCRSAGGPKESELKNIYNKCLKMQDGKNSSNSKNSGDQWKERPYDQSDWDKDEMGSKGRSREERSGGRSDRKSGTDGRLGSYGDSNTGSNYGSGNYGEDADGSSYDRMGRYGDHMGSSMHGYGSSNHESSNNYNSGYGGDRGYNKDDYNNQRNDFASSGQYGYQSSTQSPRRYRRDRRTQNSGQRSQFNPNSKKSMNNADQTDGSSKENTTKDYDEKACALHCFLQDLEMTAEDGIPDKYLVTHALTKDVTNEDLKDFLQESIDECFQILDNENVEEKCEFSKNLLMCLSEKGRANCDDWKDDLRF